MLRTNEVIDVLNLSASDNLITASAPKLLPVLSEKEMNHQSLPPRLIEVRDEFDLSASDNWIAPSSPMAVPALCETGTKKLLCYCKD
jgi:hypothetical protein